jgi:hypothetical protein
VYAPGQIGEIGVDVVGQTAIPPTTAYIVS